MDSERDVRADPTFCLKLLIEKRRECNLETHLLFIEDRGSTVAKVLCYKSEGHWFDPS